MNKELTIKNLRLSKEYKFIDKGVKETLRGKKVKIVELDVSKNFILGEMLEDSLPSRNFFNQFKKGQRLSISFATYLTEI